jgi:hypothetical protein
MVHCSGEDNSGQGVIISCMKKWALIDGKKDINVSGKCQSDEIGPLELTNVERT